MEGAWEVVCVIKELPHALFTRSGDDLVYRICVTEDELDHQIKASIPLLGAKSARGPAEETLGGAWGAPASCESSKRAGKTKTKRGSRSKSARGGGRHGEPEQESRSTSGRVITGVVEVAFHEDEFDLSGPAGSMLGRKICEQRIRGEGMPVKGSPQRGDMVVELLVGNRLQVLVLRYGVASGVARLWGFALYGLMLLRNYLWLLVGHVRRSALAQRVGSEMVKVYLSAKRVLNEVVGPWAPMLQEGAVHVGLFCVLMFVNPLYAWFHAISIAVRLYADTHR